MISKVSTFLGPNGLYRSGATPSLVLSLDSTNSMSYPPTGFTVSGGGTTHILDERNDIPWDGYGGNYLQGGVFQDSATPLAGWYLVDDNGTIRQVLGDSVWFSSGNPTPILNGGGWFMVLDGPYTISNTYSTSITFYESLPTVSNLYNGSNWFDISKRKNNGVLNDVTPLVGNDLVPAVSLSFDGSTSYISFTQSDGIPLGNSPYTIEVWFNSNSYSPGEQGPFLGWGTTGVTDATNVFRLSGNGLYNYWWGDDLNITFAGTSSMIVGNWYYAVATFDGTNRSIYLNGELKSSAAPSGVHNVTDATTLQIGHFYNSYFNGRISKVKISDKSLPDSKILSNFNTDKITYGYEFGSMNFNDTQSPYLISTSNDYAFGTNDFTIEAFFKLSLSSYGYTGVISQRHVGQFKPSINIQQASTSTPLIEFCSLSGWLVYTASNDTWYHTAISRTGGTTSYYVNGELFNQVSDTTNYTDDTLVVGRYYTEYDNYYFNGIISNVRIVKGTGLYSGSTITVPTPKLIATTDTKFLINSQRTTPTTDLSGNLQSVTSSNIGWTASVPYFYEFNYDDFSSTTGLVLLGTDGITSNHIYLTNTANSANGNVFRSDAIRFDRSFSFEWVFECSGGNGADGFCVQWTSVNDVNGGVGGDVSMLPLVSTINALKFLTWSNNSVVWFHSDSLQSSQPLSGFNIRQNVYYWSDYNHNTSTMNVYYSTTSTKPGSPQHTFTSFTFDSGTYYIGFGAATGGSNDNHILKSMKLTF